MDAPGPRYSGGEDVRLGDRVAVFGSARGEVVFVIERGEFASGFPAADWAYLARGFMIREDDGTLVHYERANPELRLLSRVSSPGRG